MCMLLQNFWCLMMRTSTKFARTRVRNFIIFLLNNSYHNSVTSRNQDKVVLIFLSHALNTTEKSLLSKGHNVTIPPKNINYADYMLPFEWQYSDVYSLDVSNSAKEFIKSRLRDSTFSSYMDTSKAFEKNLLKAEFDALKLLLKNKDIIVQKADKGHSEQKRWKAIWNYVWFSEGP